MKKVLLIACALYLLIAPLMYHPDNKTVLRWASLGDGAVWNIYTFQDANPTIDARFNYPPIHFYLAKLQYVVGTVIGGPGFTSWLDTPNESDAFEPNLPRYSLAIKLVLLLATLVVGQLIYQLVVTSTHDTRKSIWAASLWLFNPVVLYSVVMMGQNDVLAILFFLLGWYIFKGKWWYVSAILFATSIGIKFYPLIWLVFLLASAADRKMRDRIFVGLATMLLTLIEMVPFISSLAFRTNVLQSSINDRFWVPQISIGYDEVVYIIPVLLVVACLFSFVLHNDDNKALVLRRQAVGVLIANAVLLGFSHFHPQWFTWLIPFWSITFVLLSNVVRPRYILASVLGLCSWLLVILLFKDVYLSMGLVLPLRGDLLFLPKIVDALSLMKVETARLTSIAHTILAGLALSSFALLFETFIPEVHKQLTNFVSFSIRSKYLKLFVALISPTIIVIALIFATQLLPIPTVIRSQGQPRYVELPPSFSEVFTTPKYGSIKRIDIAFRNPGLLSTQNIKFDILDQSQQSVHTVQFSSKNIGDPTLIRFDLLQPLTADTVYTLHLSSIAADDAPVLYGLVAADTTQVWKTIYVVPTNRIMISVQSSIDKYIAIMSQLWLLYLVISLLLFYSLSEPLSKKK